MFAFAHLLEIPLLLCKIYKNLWLSSPGSKRLIFHFSVHEALVFKHELFQKKEENPTKLRKLKQNSINMLVIFNSDDARFCSHQPTNEKYFDNEKTLATFFFESAAFFQPRENYEKRFENNHNFAWWISIMKLKLKQLRKKI